MVWVGVGGVSHVKVLQLTSILGYLFLFKNGTIMIQISVLTNFHLWLPHCPELSE